jgi:hypothetical protein
MNSSTLLLRYLSSEKACKMFGFCAGMAWSILDNESAPIKIYYEREITHNEKFKYSENYNYSEKYNASISKASILENPLTSLFWGSINGCFMAWCSTFVSGCLPYTARPLVPIFLTLSVLDNCIRNIKKYKRL